MLPALRVGSELPLDDFDDEILPQIQIAVGPLQIGERVPTPIANVEVLVSKSCKQALDSARILDLSQESRYSTSNLHRTSAPEHRVHQLASDLGAHALERLVGGSRE